MSNGGKGFKYVLQSWLKVSNKIEEDNLYTKRYVLSHWETEMTHLLHCWTQLQVWNAYLHCISYAAKISNYFLKDLNSE